MNTLNQQLNHAAQVDLLKKHIAAAAKDLWEQLMSFILTLPNAQEEEEAKLNSEMQGAPLDGLKYSQNKPLQSAALAVKSSCLCLDLVRPSHISAIFRLIDWKVLLGRSLKHITDMVGHIIVLMNGGVATGGCARPRGRRYVGAALNISIHATVRT